MEERVPLTVGKQMRVACRLDEWCRQSDQPVLISFYICLLYVRLKLGQILAKSPLQEKARDIRFLDATMMNVDQGRVSQWTGLQASLAPNKHHCMMPI